MNKVKKVISFQMGSNIEPWITSCRNDNLETVSQNFEQMIRKRSSKFSSYPSLTGLLVASFFGAERVTKKLFPFEFNLFTECDLQLPIMTCIGEQTYNISKQSTCLQLAILRGHYNIANTILEMIESDQKFFAIRGHRNYEGQNALEILIQMNNTAGVTLLKEHSRYFITYEFLHVGEKINALSNAIYFGNGNVLQLMLSLLNNRIYAPIVVQQIASISRDPDLKRFPTGILANESEIKQSFNLIEQARSGQMKNNIEWASTDSRPVTRKSLSETTQTHIDVFENQVVYTKVLSAQSQSQSMSQKTESSEVLQDGDVIYQVGTKEQYEQMLKQQDERRQSQNNDNENVDIEQVYEKEK